uniref:mitogen-activated protein kinase kinase n=1 Tax=Acrobeloides nanus TaxID=290746 RepID=A0A914DWN2_9BILA
MMNWTGEIKLIDFGVSRCLTNSIAETFVGTMLYLPPERFEDYGKDVYDNRADVWSLGITLLELVRGFNPYGETRNELPYMVNKIRNSKIDELIEECFCSGRSFSYSPQLKSFIRSCLNEYNIRPRCEDLKRTPFYEFYSSISKDHIAKELKNIKEHTDKVGENGKDESKHENMDGKKMLDKNGATLLKVTFYNYSKILSNKFGKLVQKLTNTQAHMKNKAAESNYMLKTLEHIDPLNVTSYGGILLLIPQCNNLKFPRDEQEYPFRIKDFDFIDHIFTNTKSIVERYRHKNTGNTVVMKFVRIPDYNERGEDWSPEKVRREIENHKSLNGSPVIVNLYGFCVYGNYVIFVMESMDMSLTNLYKKWHRRHQSFPENLIGYICTRVINALLACRTNSIMHRDIKPHNILINRNGEVKLCDFGVSKLVPESVASTFVGTLEYWPPERIRNIGASYGAESDVWSLGRGWTTKKTTASRIFQ